jgi:hypothetical protein
MSIKKNEMQHFLPAKSNLATDAYEAVSDDKVMKVTNNAVINQASNTCESLSDEKVLMLTMANKHTKT